MLKLSEITKNSALESSTSTLYQDFSIQLDANLLLQLMSSYNLKAYEVTGDYFFNAFTFKQFIDTAPYNTNINSIENTIAFISDWPQKLSWSQLNQYINQLLLAWLNDYKLGAKLDAAFLIARCLELKTTKNTEFQSLLIHLFARVTNELEHYKFNYVQNFDLDTGLPNQHLLLNLLKLNLSDDSKQSKIEAETNHLGLILINLNINYGETSQLNSAATNLILAAIRTIQEHLNNDATLFQVDTLDLAILIKPLKSPTQLNLIATKLSHAFETALPLENITLILSPSFGAISTFNIQANAISLYEYARLTLHQAIAKNETIKIYDKNISSAFMNNRLLDEAIIEALQQNELSLYLQPIITIYNSGEEKDFKERCSSAEALLRWPNQDWQGISPPRILDVIYKKGFGKVFIRWLINNACQRIAELTSKYDHNISITINLGSADLLDEDLPELLAQSIALWLIPADSLTIEITENDLLVNEVKVMQVLNKITQLGCKLALDDFGTGYSSMARLRNMPINIVKIDQSFVRNISSSPEDKQIVLSIIKLAHSLGKQVVAEGVEDIACLDILKEMHCDKIQGYYYGKPMPFDTFTQWLSSFQPLKELN